LAAASERASRRRGERAGAGSGGRGEARRGGGAASGLARGGGGGERAARRNRERSGEKGEKGRRRAVYLLSLPSARDLALGKDFLKILKYSLSSARSLALGKVFFAECHLDDTRQESFTILCRVLSSWHSVNHPLPSVICGHSANYFFIFFYFPYQTFCGMFLHYVDLHVPFWDNYNSVFYS
jgi:hypothetical protein